jgi:beta-xylosidase
MAYLYFLFPALLAHGANITFLDPTSQAKTPVLDRDFPDPSLVQDSNGTWYAFATSGGGKSGIQVASAPAPEGPWKYLDIDALPNSGAWTTGRDNWAPDVRRVADGTFVMYYSGAVKDVNKHCVGVATSRTPVGPYTPQAQAWECDLSIGGAIDPAGFLDTRTGRRYVAYKVDGNSIGHGGACGNTVEPKVPTPIMLQEVSAADGVTKIGAAVKILDHQTQDGPLVEAPNIVLTREGLYVLFFSAWCYDSPQYNVNYAIARSVEGPYVRGEPLLTTGKFNLTAPGGATSTETGQKMLFHADCPGKRGRCMFEAAWGVVGAEGIDSEP